MSYVYDGQFTGNILVVGRTACGKTGFVQRLAVNNFWGILLRQNGYLISNLIKKGKLKYNLVLTVS